MNVFYSFFVLTLLLLKLHHLQHLLFFLKLLKRLYLQQRKLDNHNRQSVFRLVYLLFV